MSMDQYTDRHHPDYIPGTFNIYASFPGDKAERWSRLKKDSCGVLLTPQPSDSPNDPLNWSVWRKYVHFGLMSFITAFTAATSNNASAAQDSLNELYGITFAAMNTGAGVLFLCIGWGTLVFAPLSSLYGRKITYMICIGFGLLGAIWFASTSNTNDAIWSQALVGVSEACAEAQVQLSLSDIFFQHQLGSVLTVYILCTSIGTFLGPLIAGYISSLTNFRWVGWVGAIVSGGLLLAFLFFCEETYFDRKAYITPLTWTDSSILRRNSSSSSMLTVNANINEDKASGGGKDSDEEHCRLERTSLLDGAAEDPKPYHRRIALITKASNLKGWGFKQYLKYIGINMRMFLFPPVWLSGLFWGIQDVFLSFYLTTEEDYYPEQPWNFSNYQVALMNVPTLVGAVVGCMYAGVISDYFVLWMARRNGGIMEAEYRLYFSAPTAFLGTLGLLLFGIGTEQQLSLSVVYGGLVLIGFSWGCSGDIAMSFLMDCYPEMVLEGMVCTSVINNTLSCIFTFFCSPFIEAVGTQNSYIFLAVVNFSVTLLAWPMLVYGKKVRKLTTKWYNQSIDLRDGV
ncbi:ADR336Cp [Eremothecium gossypii ATCC 10895]|uniref:ADR336Cp n=1 Tax=Eremothecium gossypii (strain ATCC 10895 / CBS 109.51 / FGSC 9923 / NRRL Y-1056) TaxID=284811 RepID=Q759E1_EREGS|nr:ADR336Cp [Eremothecium gossypii ATCC 10895]AAS52256.1 ADR336Cp [Eremothecium gossypii ATCC 10895]AEY96555.1 FADR336Cp [Eremothecium gossypii FDAG1]